jgi:hypothetical protein
MLESFHILSELDGQRLHGELLFLSGELVELEAEQREGACPETDQPTFVGRIFLSCKRLASRHRRGGAEAVR